MRKTIIALLLMAIPFISQSQDTNMWGEIKLSEWEQTPCIKHKVATENDVINGCAVFYIDGNTSKHFALDIKIPSLAYLKNTETNSKTIVIIIQAEENDNQKLIGYRFIEGGNGMSQLDELELFSTEQLNKQ